MQREELEEEIISLRLQHRYASIKLRAACEKLDGFMADYYASVGDLAQELAALESDIAEYDRKIQGLPPVQPEIGEEDFDSYNIVPREEMLARGVKNLYRKLIETVHPEISEERLQAAEYALTVNRTYNEKNLQQLMRLDMMISRRGASAEHLAKKRGQLFDAVAELRRQLDNLRDNPVYKLRKKLHRQPDNGQVMIRQIRHKMEMRINAAQRLLMEKKLEYQEKMREKVVA